MLIACSEPVLARGDYCVAIGLERNFLMRYLRYILELSAVIVENLSDFMRIK